jgi:pimeloyl-ACP methyl ester carboxylesterase
MLAGERSGEGTAVVLLHGLTATRRYVVMGSTLLQRSGHDVIAYDARGHGASDPPVQRDAYTYPDLDRDLLAVIDSLGIERALLAGASMGAHTAVGVALRHPERVLGLALITPSFDPDTPLDDAALASWDALARGLREGGVEGFLSAYDFSRVSEDWRPTIEQVIRQRLSAHEHPQAVADALEVVPRSRPFERISELGDLRVPVVVVASRDEADSGHPLAVGERYARAIPGARLVVEPPPPPVRSPIAWQGGQLSKLLQEVAAEAE